jgi:hypothetical protein
MSPPGQCNINLSAGIEGFSGVQSKTCTPDSML